MAKKSLYRQISFFAVHRILHTDDKPSRIALGVAIGMFIAWLPLIGLQMLLVLGLTFIFRANKVVGLPIVWISNPFTLGPIYYPSYLLGSVMLRLPLVSMASLESRFAEFASLSWSLRIRECVDLLFGDIFYPTLIGSLVIGAPLAIATYFLTLRAVRRHRIKKIARRARKLSKLAERNLQIAAQMDAKTTSPEQEPESKVG